MDYKLQMNSEYFGALGWQKNLPIQVIEEGQVAGVDVDGVEDLADGGHAAACWSLHLQFLSFDDVLSGQVGGVDGGDEDFIVGVLLVLEL